VDPAADSLPAGFGTEHDPEPEGHEVKSANRFSSGQTHSVCPENMLEQVRALRGYRL
jgi:hypothetical protein